MIPAVVASFLEDLCWEHDNERDCLQQGWFQGNETVRVNNLTATLNTQHPMSAHSGGREGTFFIIKQRVGEFPSDCHSVERCRSVLQELQIHKNRQSARAIRKIREREWQAWPPTAASPYWWECPPSRRRRALIITLINPFCQQVNNQSVLNQNNHMDN